MGGCRVRVQSAGAWARGGRAGLSSAEVVSTALPTCLRSGAKPIAGSPTKEAPSRSTSSAPGLITVKPSSVGATPVACGTTVRTMVHACICMCMVRATEALGRHGTQ